LATLSIAGCATTPSAKESSGKSDSEYVVAHTSGGSNCRRLGKPGDAKIQIYCLNDARSVRLLFGSLRRSCRMSAMATNFTVMNICGTAAEWDTFDTWAASAGITCRWDKFREVCLTAPQWQQ